MDCRVTIDPGAGGMTMVGTGKMSGSSGMSCGTRAIDLDRPLGAIGPGPLSFHHGVVRASIRRRNEPTGDPIEGAGWLGSMTTLGWIRP
jgi:hypothetical protein